jgi:FkbM family methyltransferase
MNIFGIIRNIVNHPFNKGSGLKAIGAFGKWQINNLLNPYPVLYPLTGKSTIIAFKGLTGVTGNIYCGLLEFADMGFLLHFLRPSDLFIDIGANAGVYTVLSSADIGASTIAVEPIPDTFSLLLQNININGVQEKVTLYNIALGRQAGKLSFTKNLDTVNHVVAAGDDTTDVVEVDVKMLDELCRNRAPALIKIDVEGFESEVLEGAAGVLQQPALKAIIIELNGSGARYGTDENKIHLKLLDLGFEPYTYEPFSRQLTKLKTFSTHNTIYVRDYDYVLQRIVSAAKVRVRHKQF